MIHSSLCYLERDGCYLMLHRVKKKDDVNAGKWIGVGGKVEENESPDECCRREVLEETGLRINRLYHRGIITFVNDRCEGEYMHLFTGIPADGEPGCCDEGELAWVPKEAVGSLNLWQGDRLFLQQMDKSSAFFDMKLVYSGDTLLSAWLDGALIFQRQE